MVFLFVCRIRRRRADRHERGRNVLSALDAFIRTRDRERETERNLAYYINNRSCVTVEGFLKVVALKTIVYYASNMFRTEKKRYLILISA